MDSFTQNKKSVYERSGNMRIMIRIFFCVCKILLRAVSYKSRDKRTRRRGYLGRFRAALSVIMLCDEWKQELAGSWNNNDGGRRQR